MKQKITKINWSILLFTFIVEFVLLNIILISKLDISLYNNFYNLIKVLTVCVALDLIFILYILDFSINKKKPKKIAKIYNADVNLKIPKIFIVVEIIKVILILMSVGRTVMYYEERYMSIIKVYIFTVILYYLLYFIMPKKDNLESKLNKFQYDIKKSKTRFNFILIDGNITPSSFDLEKIPEYEISKNNIYMNIEKDFLKITNKKARNLILDNTVAIIHELENTDSNLILETYKKQEINNNHMYHIMAIKNYEETDLEKSIKYVNAIKICDINSAIEFTENLFSINADEKIGQFKYKNALRKIKKIDNLDFLENLNIIYQYNFNNRLKQRTDNIPKEKILFEMYRNALINESAYQSILILFNYITAMGKIVEYYLYAKNNPKFDKNKIKKAIIGDNPPIWNNHILLNIYKNEENILYRNLRQEKYKLSVEDKLLINVYLSNLLNIEIIGDEITYDGLMNLFIQFRNKVEAHGIISDANVYAVWNLTCFFANMLNKMFKISELECEYDLCNGSVKIGYGHEEKIDVGKYIVIKDEVMCFIKDKDLYINYFTGEIINNVVQGN